MNGDVLLVGSIPGSDAEDAMRLCAQGIGDHVPVPKDRADDAYFEPLNDLEIGNARLYIGLVYHTDGIEGSLARLDVAKRHAKNFGVATECGFGRRPRDTIGHLLEIHRAVAEAL